MGFFTSSNKTAFPWNHLDSVEELNEILATSSEKPVLIFKHSTRCSISSMALNRFENEWNQSNDEANLYYLDLIKHREISNEIALATKVIHQSPQAIVIRNKEVIYDASHNSISAKTIQSLLSK